MSNGNKAAAGVSHIERMLAAKDQLPRKGQLIFEALYQRGIEPRAAAREMGLSEAEFDAERVSMLRALKSAAGAAVAA